MCCLPGREGSCFEKGPFKVETHCWWSWIIWERDVCKNHFVVMVWASSKRELPCVGFHVWRWLFPLTLDCSLNWVLNLKEIVSMEPIMICMPVKKGKKSKKEVESILLDKTEQTDKTHRSGKLPFPQNAEATTLPLSSSQHPESPCSLRLGCSVECLPHPSLWKCSGSPLFLRDL